MRSFVVQEVKAKKPTRAAKAKQEGGQPKRPRGRPRKAPQQQKLPQQKPAAKRKAAAAALDDHESEAEMREDPPRRRGRGAKAAKPTLQQQPLQHEYTVQVTRAFFTRTVGPLTTL